MVSPISSRICALAALLSLFGSSATSQAEAPPPAVETPEEVHAAFTINLTRFISWPNEAFASPTAPLVIGTFARDPINRALDALAEGEVVDGHAVQTTRLRSLDDVLRCHVVFLSRDEQQQRAVLARVAGKPILTISDASDFLELGGHVRFVSRPPHTRLRINAENIRASGLHAQAQLLRIAEVEAL